MGMINLINDIVWGTPALVMMLSAGILFTAGTGFFQFRHPIHWLKCTVFSSSKNHSSQNSLSQFEAMSSALAATLGTGNIAGVSAALASGGAGAVFWMWISALFGTMTGFAENVLGIYYRRSDEKGKWHGGAMCYIEGGLSEKRYTRLLAKPLAVLFAVLCVLSAFGMGNMVQMNSAAGALQNSFSIPPIITGVSLAAAEAFIIFGGAKKTGSVTAKLVPFMSGFYILGSLWLIAENITRLPGVFGAIFEGAFGIDAVGGGISGYLIKQAISIGFRRGIFSNEAGLGTSVAAHAAAEVTEPCVQGMWSIFEVFFDTIVMCSLTAVVLLAAPCTAPTAEEAFASVSTRPQYFRLTESDGIITSGAPMISTLSPTEEISFRTVYKTSFDMGISRSGNTFSNLMCIQGIQRTDSAGRPEFLDADKKVPLIDSVIISEVNGAQLAAYAFSQTFGNAAGMLLAAAVTMFAFSTVLGWSGFGSQAAVYIFGNKAEKPFKWIFIIVTAIGAVIDFSAAWSISDMINGLMAIPNLIALFLLSPKVFEITRNYCRRIFHQESIKPMLSVYTSHSNRHVAPYKKAAPDTSQKRL
ncbi:MAG: sodium:alanine symporter family protein [Oscillospiraceae bacterium]|nr:sodium:alanine symporter family protein [Oscillospiraceae bacterium]